MERYWLSKVYQLHDISVEVTVWLNLVADDGPYGEQNDLKPIMQLHDNI